MSRIPIRIRITLAYAVVMAVLLPALGAFIDVRFGDQLDHEIDQPFGTDSIETVRGSGYRLRENGGSA